METPSSTRTHAAQFSFNNSTITLTKKINPEPKRDRFALLDMTNDSPIAGLAIKLPLSSVSKHETKKTSNTPGSGETLLRGQVKTLLQKMDVETEDTNFMNRLRGLVHYPTGLFAPANSPEVEDGGGFISASPVVEKQENISQMWQMVTDYFKGREEEKEEPIKRLGITRSLLPDFSDTFTTRKRLCSRK